MPFLYKRKRSPYWYVGLSPREKEILNTDNFSTKEKNRRAAEIVLRQVKQDLITKTEYRSSSTSITLDRAYEMFKQDRENTGKAFDPKTIAAYDFAVRRMKEIIGDKKINDFTREDYHKFVDNLNGKQNTKASVTKRIFALFNWLVKEGHLAKNPMKRVQERQKEFRIKTKEEIEHLKEYAKNNKLYWFVRFQLVSGFRLTEMLTLKRKDIEDEIIRIVRKGNVPNYIPITSRMRYLLSEMPLPTAPDRRVFPYSKDQVVYFFARLEDKKNLGLKITSHELRKYCLSEMANAGIAINFVKDYAGHSKIETTMKYYIRSDKMKMKDEIDNKLPEE